MWVQWNITHTLWLGPSANYQNHAIIPCLLPQIHNNHNPQASTVPDVSAENPPRDRTAFVLSYLEMLSVNHKSPLSLVYRKGSSISSNDINIPQGPGFARCGSSARSVFCKGAYTERFKWLQVNWHYQLPWFEFSVVESWEEIHAGWLLVLTSLIMSANSPADALFHTGKRK